MSENDESSSDTRWGCGSIAIVVLVVAFIAGIIAGINNSDKDINQSSSKEQIIAKVIDKDPTSKLSNLEGDERQYMIKSWQYLYNTYQKNIEIIQ